MSLCLVLRAQNQAFIATTFPISWRYTYTWHPARAASDRTKFLNYFTSSTLLNITLLRHITLIVIRTYLPSSKKNHLNCNSIY